VIQNGPVEQQMYPTVHHVGDELLGHSTEVTSSNKQALAGHHEEMIDTHPTFRLRMLQLVYLSVKDVSHHL
jgi:hypothetical protein